MLLSNLAKSAKNVFQKDSWLKSVEVREFEDQFVNVYGNRFLFLCPPNEFLGFPASGGQWMPRDDNQITGREALRI